MAKSSQPKILRKNTHFSEWRDNVIGYFHFASHILFAHAVANSTRLTKTSLEEQIVENEQIKPESIKDVSDCIEEWKTGVKQGSLEGIDLKAINIPGNVIDRFEEYLKKRGYNKPVHELLVYHNKGIYNTLKRDNKIKCERYFKAVDTIARKYKVTPKYLIKDEVLKALYKGSYESPIKQKQQKPQAIPQNGITLEVLKLQLTDPDEKERLNTSWNKYGTAKRYVDKVIIVQDIYKMFPDQTPEAIREALNIHHSSDPYRQGNNFRKPSRTDGCAGASIKLNRKTRL